MRAAHILSLEDATGQAADGRYVCHTCDNPPCCNPRHLWFGSNSENQIDCSNKGRKNLADTTGEMNGHAVLNESAVKEIRRLSALGYSNTELGHMFGVSHGNIYAIKRRISWRHI